jgi:hypothetical protein
MADSHWDNQNAHGYAAQLLEYGRYECLWSVAPADPRP